MEQNDAYSQIVILIPLFVIACCLAAIVAAFFVGFELRKMRRLMEAERAERKARLLAPEVHRI